MAALLSAQEILPGCTFLSGLTHKYLFNVVDCSSFLSEILSRPCVLNALPLGFTHTSLLVVLLEEFIITDSTLLLLFSAAENPNCSEEELLVSTAEELLLLLLLSLLLLLLLPSCSSSIGETS
jgi:hypothetical protein